MHPPFLTHHVSDTTFKQTACNSLKVGRGPSNPVISREEGHEIMLVKPQKLMLLPKSSMQKGSHHKWATCTTYVSQPTPPRTNLQVINLQNVGKHQWQLHQHLGTLGSSSFSLKFFRKIEPNIKTRRKENKKHAATPCLLYIQM